MTIKILSSNTTDGGQAARELLSQVGTMRPTLILWFASPARSPSDIATVFSKAHPDSACIGCTSSGELIDTRMLKGSLVALVADAESIPFARARLVADAQSEGTTSEALRELSGLVDVQSPGQLDPSRFVGLVLVDGLSGAEESVMAQLSGATNVPFVGGSAGDDLAFEKSQVYVGAEGGSGSAALVLIQPKDGYSILKTQSFEVLDPQVLEVTECDPATRTVIAFNNQPAAVAYAEALGVSPEDLPSHFARRPLGLLLESGEPYVRSPRAVEGTRVKFYCQMLEGMKLHVLRATDIVEQTQSDLRRALDSAGKCSALINFHCILRTLELEAQEQCDDYGAVFEGVPTVGLTTYGECYVGHINQTSTMVLLH